MSVLSIVMLIASIFFLYLVIRNINKNNILFEQAFMWIVISLVMIIISIFDAIPVYFAELLGFELTSNFLLSLAIFFLLVMIKATLLFSFSGVWPFIVTLMLLFRNPPQSHPFHIPE